MLPLQNKMKLKYKNLNLKIQGWQIVKVLFEIDWGGEQKGKEEWGFIVCFFGFFFYQLILQDLSYLN